MYSVAPVAKEPAQEGSVKVPSGTRSTPDPLPFRLTISPVRAFPHRSWVAARDATLAAAGVPRRQLVLVVGATGVGKTLLLQEVARLLSERGTRVALLPRGDLLIQPAEIATAGPDSEANEPWVVLIDEACHLNAAQLARLEQWDASLLVLAGLAEGLAQSLPDAVVVHLDPLRADEVGEFVAARLQQAGLDGELVSPDAVQQLYDLSGGVPRVLTMLAGLALFSARREQAPRVGARHVDEAASLRDGRDSGRSAQLSSSGTILSPPRCAVSDAAEAPPDRKVTPTQTIPEVHPRPLLSRFVPSALAAAVCCIGLATFAWVATDHALRHPDRERHQVVQPTVAAVDIRPVTTAGALAPTPAPAKRPAAAKATPTARKSGPADAPSASSGTDLLRTPRLRSAPALAPPPAAPTIALPSMTVRRELFAAGTSPRAPDRAGGQPAAPAISPAARATPTTGGRSLPLPSESLAATRPSASVGSSRPSAPDPSSTPGTEVPRQSLAALPAAAPPRVVVLTVKGDTGGPAQADRLARILRHAGFAVVRPKGPLPRGPSAGAVRYFFQEDRTAAAAVAGAVGLSSTVTLADAAGDGLIGPPPPGLVEVVVPSDQIIAGSAREQSGKSAP